MPMESVRACIRPVVKARAKAAAIFVEKDIMAPRIRRPKRTFKGALRDPIMGGRGVGGEVENRLFP